MGGRGRPTRRGEEQFGRARPPPGGRRGTTRDRAPPVPGAARPRSTRQIKSRRRADPGHPRSRTIGRDAHPGHPRRWSIGRDGSTWATPSRWHRTPETIHARRERRGIGMSGDVRTAGGSFGRRWNGLRPGGRPGRAACDPRDKATARRYWSIGGQKHAGHARGGASTHRRRRARYARGGRGRPAKRPDEPAMPAAPGRRGAERPVFACRRSRGRPGHAHAKIKANSGPTPATHGRRVGRSGTPTPATRPATRVTG